MTESDEMQYFDDESTMYERAAYFFSHDYQDRGMVKWQGYFLSDHTEDVKKKAAEETAAMTRQRMPEMDLSAITNILMHAYANNEVIQVQTSGSHDDGIIPPIIEGHVDGYTENGVIVNQTEIPLGDLWWTTVL